MNYNGYSINVVREHNLKVISNLLYERSLSCKELAEITELSETAVKKNITQLIDAGVVKVFQEVVEKKNVGRQHIRYQINKKFGAFCCIDFSYGHDSLMICDVCGNILHKEKLDFKVQLNYHDYEMVASKAKEIAKKLNTKIHEVAISIPGQIDEITGIIDFSSRIQGKENVNIFEHFQKLFPNTLIIIQNDIRFSVQGDALLQERSKDTMALYIQIGYGMVSAIIKNSKIMFGYKGIAGEIGTTCDKNGVDLHTKCAISSLMLKAKEKYNFNNLEEFLKLYNDNSDIQELVLESARNLAFEINSISNALGCNNIVLLGEVTKLGNPYLFEVQTTLDKLTHYFEREVCFLLDDDLTEKGMIKLLKERVCYSINK